GSDCRGTGGGGVQLLGECLDWLDKPSECWGCVDRDSRPSLRPLGAALESRRGRRSRRLATCGALVSEPENARVFRRLKPLWPLMLEMTFATLFRSAVIPIGSSRMPVDDG